MQSTQPSTSSRVTGSCSTAAGGHANSAVFQDAELPRAPRVPPTWAAAHCRPLLAPPCCLFLQLLLPPSAGPPHLHPANEVAPSDEVNVWQGGGVVHKLSQGQAGRGGVAQAVGALGVGALNLLRQPARMACAWGVGGMGLDGWAVPSRLAAVGGRQPARRAGGQAGRRGRRAPHHS